MKQKWEMPELVTVSALPPYLGHCAGGETEIATGPNQGCYNGSQTAGPTGIGHYCSTGGVAGLPPGIVT